MFWLPHPRSFFIWSWNYHLNHDIRPSVRSLINPINHSLRQRGSSLHFSKFGFWKNAYYFHIMVARLDGQNTRIASKLTPQEKVVTWVGCTSLVLFVAEKSESWCMGCWAIIITCISRPITGNCYSGFGFSNFGRQQYLSLCECQLFSFIFPLLSC